MKKEFYPYFDYKEASLAQFEKRLEDIYEHFKGDNGIVSKVIYRDMLGLGSRNNGARNLLNSKAGERKLAALGYRFAQLDNKLTDGILSPLTKNANYYQFIYNMMFAPVNSRDKGGFNDDNELEKGLEIVLDELKNKD